MGFVYETIFVHHDFSVLPKLFFYFLIGFGNSVPILFASVFFLVLGFCLKFFIPHFLYIMSLIISLLFFVFYVYDVFMNIFLKRFSKEKIPPSNEHLDDLEVMKVRRSVRAYQKRKLLPKHYTLVRETIHQIEKESKKHDIRFLFLEESFHCLIVTDPSAYIIAVIPSGFNETHVLNVGYYLQEIVLRLTKSGISTCWIGGFLAQGVLKKLKEMTDYNSDREHVACLCGVGYQSKYESFAIRAAMNSSRTRYPPSYMFFDYDTMKPIESFESLEDEKMEELLELCRWYPNSSNCQDTRVVKEGKKKFHFYKIGRSFYYSTINVGIMMRIWNNTCEFLGLEGEFIEKDPELTLPKQYQGLKYFRTFVFQ